MDMTGVHRRMLGLEPGMGCELTHQLHTPAELRDHDVLASCCLRTFSLYTLQDTYAKKGVCPTVTRAFSYIQVLQSEHRVPAQLDRPGFCV